MALFKGVKMDSFSVSISYTIYQCFLRGYVWEYRYIGKRGYAKNIHYLSMILGEN